MSEDTELREESEAPEGRERGASSGDRKRASSAKELLLSQVTTRAQSANARLRENLAGSVLIRIKGANPAQDQIKERYIFDWKGETSSVVTTDSDSAECVVTISELILLKINSGEINPQVAMLSDKIQVSGKISLAIYFFNLIVPFSSLNR